MPWGPKAASVHYEKRRPMSGARREDKMGVYILSAICVVIGAILLVAGIFMGVTPNANYVVEGAFGMFVLAAAVFVLSVLAGLVKEFRETA
jgi:uncharacterized membrane protein